MFFHRCYARALKLMSDVPSLWYDLGLNYYRQSSIPYPAEGDQNCPSLLLEKAKEVTPRILYSIYLFIFFFYIFTFSEMVFIKILSLFQCLKKAIMLESGNHSYWNALGVISMSEGNHICNLF